MSDEFREHAIDLIHYYGYHGIAEMIKLKPEFVIEDFTKLLAELEKELEK